MSTRYPLEPLAALLGIELGVMGGHQSGDLGGRRLLGEIAGVSVTTLKRAKRHGLTADQADRLAVACGLHPGWVWPQWFEDAMRSDPALAHLAGCGVPTVGRRGGLVWVSGDT